MAMLATRVDQIRRAHASARPKTSNSSWLNTHHDLSVALDYVTALEGALRMALAPDCFACGARPLDQCHRGGGSPCGREHVGGTRAPAAMHPDAAAVLQHFQALAAPADEDDAA